MPYNEFRRQKHSCWIPTFHNIDVGNTEWHTWIWLWKNIHVCQISTQKLEHFRNKDTTIVKEPKLSFSIVPWSTYTILLSCSSWYKIIELRKRSSDIGLGLIWAAQLDCIWRLFWHTRKQHGCFLYRRGLNFNGKMVGHVFVH